VGWFKLQHRSSRRSAGPIALGAAVVVLLFPGAAAGATTISATEGQSFTATVASGLVCPLLGATITWGDGSTSPGVDNGNHGIKGTHTYAEEGTSYPGSVSYTYTSNNPFSCPTGVQTATFQATASDASLSATGRSLSGSQGQSLSGVVAHFSDADAGGQASDYSAQIHWGDGSTTAGSVAAAPSAGFDVTGTHTYASAGSFAISVRIADVGSSTATASATTTITAATTTTTSSSSPPSQPSPPRVIRIDSLAPPSAGRQIVLSAVTDKPTGSIAWNLAGDSRPEITCPGAQTAVTFRAGTGTRSVTATATSGAGPGRALTTSFTVAPAAPLTAGQRATARKVNEALARHPPVYTCATPSDFAVKQVGTHPVVFDHTVKPGCPPSRTVVAGGLQFEGCLEHLTSEDQIPKAMQGMLPSFGSHLNLGGRFFTNSSAANADLTFGFVDAYIAYEPVKINGLTLIPATGAAIVVAPQLDEIVSSDAQMAVGNVDLQNKRSFIMNLAPHGNSIPLGSFARAGGGLADIAGFALGGDVTVALDDSGGTFGLTIHVHLALPSYLEVGGVSAQGNVTLRSTNADGLVIDNLSIGPIDADLGALSVQAVQLDYTRATDEWRGQGKACVIEDVCLDMIPPHGGVTIRRGSLVKLEASLDFPAPGLELFAGVALNRIGFGFGLDPTRLLANARITAETILQIDGTVVLAFPSAAAPYVLDRSEVSDFPDNFYGRTFARTTIAVGADASIVLPVLGSTALAQAYLLYEYPSYFALGGGIHANLFDVIDVSGRVDGEFNGDNGRFNLKGDIHGCVVDVVCAGVVAVISSRGVGGCLTIPFPTGDLNVGGGVQYSPFHLFLWPFDGCRWSPFVQDNVFSPHAARAAAAGSPITVRIKPGDRSRAIRLDGVNGAPSVRVRTPSGDVLESTPGSGLAHDPAIRILRGEKAKITVVGLVNPKPGVYTIEMLPGSPTLRQTSQASDQPKARLSVSVRGRGATRTLVYSIARRKAQRVTFVEKTRTGSRAIGTVNGGGRGKLHFSPAPGTDRRTIVAEFELARLPAEQLTVAQFLPPSPRLGRPAHLHVTRRGRIVQVSWRAVPGATRYELVERLGIGGEHLVRSRGHSVTLRHVARYDSGRISVRAMATLRQGKPALATLRAGVRTPTRLGPLPKPPRRHHR
jgi:hypothetical protein